MKTEHKKPIYQDMVLIDFYELFPNEEACWAHFLSLRWPDGFICPACQATQGCFKPSRKIFECYNCKRQSSITAGTMFHKTRTPLSKWFWFIFFMATSKKGVSMLYLQQQLRINSYKTVWSMGHKIRQGMAARNALYALRGVVEVDEIFVGGKQSLEDRRKFGNNKTAFFMGVEEDSSGGPKFVTFEQIESICAKQILPALEKSVEKGSKLITDGEGAYVMAQKDGYEHDRYIESKDPEIAHEMLRWINTLTSNLKRFLLSTHHGVYPKYRKAYLTEFAYRFNRRYWPEQMFDRLLYACIHSDPMTLRELKE
jgi:transposase-like protein